MLNRLRMPIWAEGRVAVEHVALLRDPVFRGGGLPRGDGAPVLLVPGFLAGDPTLTTMAGWLKRIGYRPCRAEIRSNIDCTTRGVDRLETSLESLVERRGRKAAVVGQSRGGFMARLLAMRRPDLVDRVVCLGSPVLNHFALHPLIQLQIASLATLSALGVPGLLQRGCLDGDCCEGLRELGAGPFPDGVGYVSIYSRSDGIVDWRSCLDPAARHVRIGGSHIGMSVNPQAYRAIALALDGPAVAGTPVRRLAAVH